MMLTQLSNSYLSLLKRVPFLPDSPLKDICNLFGLSYQRTKVMLYPEYKPNKQYEDIMNLYLKEGFDSVSLTTPFEFEKLVHLVNITQGTNNDIMELGTFEGGTAIRLAKYLTILNDNRKIHLCDTFEGMPYSDDAIKKE